MNFKCIFGGGGQFWSSPPPSTLPLSPAFYLCLYPQPSFSVSRIVLYGFMAALLPVVGGQPPLNRSFVDVIQNKTQLPLKIKPLSSLKGEPTVCFSEEEIDKLAAPFNHVLVGKFSHGRPSMELVRKAFAAIGFSGSYSLGLLDHRHVLIRFTLKVTSINLG